MSHASRWRACWAPVVAAGVGLGMLEWSALAVAATVVVLGALTAVVLLGAANGSSRPRTVVARSLWVAGTLVAAWAVLTLFPPIALLLGLAALLTSPLAARSVRRVAGLDRVAPPSVPDPAPGPTASSTAAPPPGPTLLQTLDDDQLCRLWRQSFWELHLQTTPAGCLRWVTVRQECLDELERRNAAALHAWLDSGARASGGPEKFWTQPHPGNADAA